jgi:hypothetical protein
LNSSNLNPSVFWRAGVQIVALNWQRWDGGMMQNEAMFAGTSGWVLKPPGYRSTSNEATQVTAIPHHNLDLSVEFFAGQNIPMPPGDDPKDFKPYIKVELHVEKPEERSSEAIPGGGKGTKGDFKKKTKTYRTPNPDFGREVVKFDGVRGVTEELTFVRYVPIHASFSSLFPFSFPLSGYFFIVLFVICVWLSVPHGEAHPNLRLGMLCKGALGEK